VAGLARGSGFPTTAQAFDRRLDGDGDGFAAKVSANGSALAYSTFLGGAADDDGLAIAVDSGSSAYVSGITRSPDFPTTVGAFDATFNGAFSGLSDAFVTKLNVTGSGLTYSTYLGGVDHDEGLGIAVDAGGSAYVTGDTGSASSDFPTTTGAFDTSSNGADDVFVTTLNPAGSGLVYSTYLGGSGSDDGFGIATDGSGNAYVAGETDATISGSSDFPTTTGAFDTIFNGGGADAFVAKFETGAPPPPAADLEVAKTDSPDPVPIGDTLTYTITVRNNGPVAAIALTLTDTPPKSVRILSVESSQGSCRLRSKITCFLDDLASGASATVTISIRPNRSGTITNTASATATSPADPNVGNNTDSETTLVR
jgi:uncharacterized repeat protein (TIGR01451 family)